MRLSKSKYFGLILKLFPFLIVLLFFAAYGTLSVVRHNNYQSFGYDLGINDQTVWRYSKFQIPIVTIAPHPDKPKYYEHVELIYALISPSYWIWSSRKMLLLLEIGFICSGGIAVFLLARKKQLNYLLSITVMVGFLTFYGVQNAIWFDVHSATFAAAFLAWFLYFLATKKIIKALLFFLLSITTKENIAFVTLFIGLAYLWGRRDKFSIVITVSSILYLLFIFFVYFPHIIHFQYPYQNQGGLISNLNPVYMFNTGEKLNTIFYSLLSYGFIPFLLPFSLLPALAHFFTFFVISSDLPGAQGIFMHYRVTLAPLLSWATIVTIVKYKRLNNRGIAIYLLICSMFVQYSLHLPLSYLSKSWFWAEPPAVKNINYVINNYLPKDGSVASQNNITPHISHRDKIYTLYPEKKKFTKNSPCGKIECDWFRWFDSPEFIIVDISSNWDARHLLIDNENYRKGLRNLEKAEIIKKYKQVGNTILYKVLKSA